MISRSKKLGFAFLAAVLFSTLPLSLAIADENSTVSQEKLSKVETNCLTINKISSASKIPIETLAYLLDVHSKAS